MCGFEPRPGDLQYLLIYQKLVANIKEVWCNGSTTDFDSVCRSSNLLERTVAVADLVMRLVVIQDDTGSNPAGHPNMQFANCEMPVSIMS